MVLPSTQSKGAASMALQHSLFGKAAHPAHVEPDGGKVDGLLAFTRSNLSDGALNVAKGGPAWKGTKR